MARDLRSPSAAVSDSLYARSSEDARRLPEDRQSGAREHVVHRARLDDPPQDLHVVRREN